MSPFLWDDGSLVPGLHATTIDDPDMPAIIREQAESVLGPFDDNDTERLQRTTVLYDHSPPVTIVRFGNCVAWYSEVV